MHMLAVIAALLTAGAAVPASPVLVAPDEGPAYAAALRSAAINADAGFSGSRCDTAATQTVAREDVRIGDRPDVAAARERVRVTGCGRSHVENVNVARLGGDPPWKITWALPGEPLAAMPLQQTAARQVISGARASVAGACSAIVLNDIYIAARPGHVRFAEPGAYADVKRGDVGVTLPEQIAAQKAKLNTSAAWVEVWPLKLCGENRTVAVVFVPSRDQQQSYFFPIPLWQNLATHPGALPKRDDRD